MSIYNKKEQIKIYNQFKNTKKAATRNSSFNYYYFNCYIVDNDWINLWKKSVNYNPKISKEQKFNKNKIKNCKILDSFDEVKGYIQNNKKFELVIDDFINSIFEYNNFIPKRIYFGLNKIIICFKEEALTKYILFLLKENKYYEFMTNDFQIIKKLINEKTENIFRKNSKYKKLNFICINNNNINNSNLINKANNVDDFKKNDIIKNNQSLSFNQNNFQDNNNNNYTQNILSKEENNKETNNYGSKIINNEIPQEENKINENILNSNNNNNINNNDTNNLINSNEESKFEQSIKMMNYEKEKEKLLLQKKINIALLNDLERINVLPHLLKNQKKLISDIEKTKTDIKNQDIKIDKLNKEIELQKPKDLNNKKEEIFGRSISNHIKKEQIKKRQELENNYIMILLKEQYEKLEKLKYIKQLFEEKLKEREMDLIKINEKIKREYEYEKEFYKKQEFLKVLLEQNQEELEKLNNINKYEEELKKVQKEREEKEKRNRIEEIEKKLKEEESSKI